MFFWMTWEDMAYELKKTRQKIKKNLKLKRSMILIFQTNCTRNLIGLKITKKVKKITFKTFYR